MKGVKRSLRKRIRRKLAGLDPAVIHARSMAACRLMTAQPEFQRARAVMLYLPMDREVDVSPLALRGWQDQKTIAAPKISWDSRHLLPIEIRSMRDGTVPVTGSLREPADGEPVAVESLDLVIVPALAFDRRGNRLGRGAGFYDRFLSDARFRGVIAGIAFREQVVKRVPTLDHDVAVHMLVTDDEVLRFAADSLGTKAGSNP